MKTDKKLQGDWRMMMVIIGFALTAFAICEKLYP
jgi:hypothetical protein